MGRLVTTPLYLQMETVECGAAALGAVLGYHGKHVPLEELRVECGVTRDGVRASNILRAATRYGLTGKAYKVELPELERLPRPAILYWQFNHFVVYEGRGRSGYRINDPASGRQVVAPEAFDRDFTGVALAFAPAAGFERSGTQFSFPATCWRWMRGSMGAICLLLSVGLLLVLPGLTLPAITEVMVDSVLVQGLSRWLTPLLLILGAAGALRFALELVKRRVLARLKEWIAVRASVDFCWRLLHLPLQFFTQRSAGELASRLLVYDEASHFFAREAPDAVLDAIVACFYVALILLYSKLLAGIAVLAAALSVGAFALFTSRLAVESAVLQHETGKAGAFLVQALSVIETIKMRGDEADVLDKVMDQKARVVGAERRLAVLRATATWAAEFLHLGGNAAALAAGAFAVMRHEMTLGDLLAFQVLMQGFLSPVNSLLSFFGGLQDIKVVAKRVDDVARYPDHDVALPEAPLGEGYGPVIELRNLSFAYGPTEPLTLDGIDLRLEPGRTVALVGATSSGKSTLAKIMCGLYRPTGGEIIVDGRRAPHVDPSVFDGDFALVDQNIVLFRGTVLDNLTMWDSRFDPASVAAATRDALVAPVIERRAGGYYAEVGEEGRNFSGGERQRLEIARALVRRPRLLVLDEATSALDTVAEARIVENIRRRGCGCLIVAHRLSTVRDCDEIVVLDRGKVIDRGTHAELAARCGRYQELVTHE
jgi:NHLM bacteriocin system ABC transporter peptidase/ATP-binding protein